MQKRRSLLAQPTRSASNMRALSRRSGLLGTTKPQLSAPRRSLLLDLPIGWRLTLGFLLAALIAAAASSIPALQRAQALGRESGFYEALLRSNTTLTTGDSFVQLMNTKVHDMLLEASSLSPSKETLASDQDAIQGLQARYDSSLNDYVHTDLLYQHSDQVALLTEARHAVQVSQQRTLASSALRTWQVYRDAQSAVTHDVAIGDIAAAQALEREQGEPTNADALSAVRALIQFNGRIASSIHDAAVVEQRNQIVTAAVATAAAFLAIALVGWVISNTLVRRLRLLRRVTQLVEQGNAQARVTVVGRDEIAAVSSSVNGMLDTIVGLLDVTRRQRDALTTAAERLFTDMRLAGAGDLRVNASVSGDPIGMLGNAFNFTIGRFRRFVLRTQTTVAQLDVIARQELDHAESHFLATQQHLRGVSAFAPSNHAQTIDLIRRSSVFSRDIAAFARQLLTVNQEMREGFAPFRLDMIDRGDAALYGSSVDPGAPSVYSPFTQSPGSGFGGGASFPGASYQDQFPRM